MAHAPTTDAQVQRELLGLTLRNSARSVPLQLLAVAWVVWLGVQAQRPLWAAAVALLGLAVGLWRLSTASRHLQPSSPQSLRRATWEVEGNAALAGAVWALATLGIYPHLSGLHGASYLVICCGAVAIAALFMSLVGHSYVLLAVPLVGSVFVVTAVSAIGGAEGAWALAVLVLLYGLTMYRAATEFRRVAADAIRQRLEADAAQASLRHAKEAAEAANLAKSQFLATMSHEIRTPMNGVLGALDLLQRSTLDGQQRRLVRTALSSGETLMAIINDVLDHAKIEAGKLTLKPAVTSLHALAASVTALLRASAQARGLALELEIAPQAPDHVLVDALRLKQVLLNLVGNAIKFTPAGTVVLRLAPRAAPEGQLGARFEVVDTGIGIEPQRLPHLFEPFYQVDGSSQRRRGGTGLGLAISRHIVDAMGGRITARSTPGQGSTFCVDLALPPAAANGVQDLPDSSVGSLDDDPEPLQGTVLLVEDNEVNRMLAREMLVSLGLEVVEAADGRQALAALETRQVDLVLMDCQMPELDGYAATEVLRARELQRGLRRLPVVALTADAFDSDAERARAAGMDAHLAKPYTRSALRSAVAAHLPSPQ
jgi:signal transduction histidine kinase/CheY-like chemotaxis protein